MTKGPIDVVKTEDGWMVLDGQHRSVEALNRGEKFIDANILSSDEALKKYGDRWPQLESVLKSKPLQEGGSLIQEARKDAYGTVKEWGTRNQYVANNPFRKQLDVMKRSGKYDMDVLKDAERWEMGQVLKDKPAFLSDNLSKEEISNFAKKNNLWFRSKGDSMVVAKDIDSLNRTLNALDSGNQRELGLALGYEDIGVPKKVQSQPLQEGGKAMNKLKSLKTDEVNSFSDFTDYVGGSYKPVAKEAQALKADVVASMKRIGMKIPQTEQGIANALGKILEKLKFKR